MIFCRKTWKHRQWRQEQEETRRKCLFGNYPCPRAFDCPHPFSLFPFLFFIRSIFGYFEWFWITQWYVLLLFFNSCWCSCSFSFGNHPFLGYFFLPFKLNANKNQTHKEWKSWALLNDRNLEKQRNKKRNKEREREEEEEMEKCMNWKIEW